MTAVTRFFLISIELSNSAWLLAVEEVELAHRDLARQGGEVLVGVQAVVDYLEARRHDGRGSLSTGSVHPRWFLPFLASLEEKTDEDVHAEDGDDDQQRAAPGEILPVRVR